MENKSLSSIVVCALFLLHLSEAFFTPQDNYLLNCGTNKHAMFDNREFLGDEDGDDASSSVSGKDKSIQLISQNPSPYSVYNTARVFKTASSYTFRIKKMGVHFLRLHFSPFVSQGYDLKAGNFSVSANKLLLLRSFSVKDYVVIKEFIMMVDRVELEILFMPDEERSKFAFVNAVEVFSAPDDLIIDAGAKRVGPDGVKELNQRLSAQTYETVHRINVGGSKLTPFNDTLWRTWLPDDDFLVLKSSAKVVSTSLAPRYRDGGASREVAPDEVYMTAREMNKDNAVPDFAFNLTWDFPVGSRGARYLVRLHFCDIVSSSLDQMYFNVYVDEAAAYKDLDLSEDTFHVLASPFYVDVVVDSVNSSGAVRVSVGPSELSSPSNKNAILNGVEVLRMVESSSSVDSTMAAKRRSLGRFVASMGVAFVGLIAIVFGVLVVRRWRNGKGKVKRVESTGTSSGSLRACGSTVRGTLSEAIGLAPPGLNGYFALRIPFTEVQLATNNFDEHSVIGLGGFGMVYKGVLWDNVKVAVKRGVPGSKQGLPEFQSEITVLSKIRHRHLVSLVGYCEDRSEKILVYEYMEKGPLRNHLYGSRFRPLSWKQRLEICIGAARGLHYLHTGFARGIIHRDIKSTNILLDENYVPKVADFGLSRTGPCLNESHVSTVVKGSFGYLDPEYFRRQKLTDKSDVYSFGVVLFEVLCGRPAVDPLLAREQVNLAEWALQWQRKGLLDRVVDPHLRGQIKPHCLNKFGEIAEKCLAECGVDRPSMSDVLWNLESALHIQEKGVHCGLSEDRDSAGAESTEARALIIQPPVGEVEGLDRASDISCSQVFSQLVTREGR